ncbi:hypothetical protein H2200_008830 [Cladophialophora chaetospira]|uniref:Uncharacterized protein n=1 Tax=Cladophialophora chaetospira TaxID=386627 RepID=A0AA39CG24_9EURO|nr:hypothetical protein H2200_008830 [Cladophialophora chaetospira]
MLTSSSKVSHSTTSDVLVPAPDGRQTFSKSFSDEFVHFLKEELTLEELEAIIAAISVCVTRLWSAVFMFRPKDSTVVGFSSLSGTSFSTDQAILTEHVIWRGPLWVSRILDQYGPGERVATQIGDEIEVEEILVKEGLWKGSREEGARLAANGVARLLWKERQERIETKANASAGKVNITDIRVNPSVWRGSSGDM